VKSHDPFRFWRVVSILIFLSAIVLLVLQLVQYSLQRTTFPQGLTIGDVPLAATNPQDVQQRLLQVYSLPVEIHYRNAVIDLDPSTIGFQLDFQSMLADANLQRTNVPFWSGFWDYLWDKGSSLQQVPLVATFSEARLVNYLQDEISKRYDTPSIPAQPIAGTPNFSPGTPGQKLNIDQAVPLIESALQSPTQRVVYLTSVTGVPDRPSLDALEVLLKQIIDVNGFDGVTDLFFQDLQTGGKIQFAYQQGEDISINPDISFTASSTIKIPIMVTVFLNSNGKLDDQTAGLMADMIQKSDNTAADSLMMSLDQIRGPLIVTDTMQKLGLKNTFLAGYFYPGAPVLELFNTPANSRTDISTDPDVYSQTTPSDMGVLLEDIYQCSQNGGGTLVTVFPGQIDQTACQQMIHYLEEDKLGDLIQGGVPDGTLVAHKHGWVSDSNGIIHHVSDVGIIYTPGGNFILNIYTYHPVQVNWDQDAAMFAVLARTAYNYFNIPSK